MAVTVPPRPCGDSTKARHGVARAGAGEAQKALVALGDASADAGQTLGVGGKHVVGLVQIRADHADAVVVLRVTVVKVCLGRIDAGVQIELVAHLEGVAAKALVGTVWKGLIMAMVSRASSGLSL